MDLVGLFDNPFNRTAGSVTLPLMAFVLSVLFGLFLRRMEWLGAAALAAFVSAMTFFVMYTTFYGMGPLSLVGLGMMFAWGLIVTIPTVGLIRLLMRWILGKPNRAE